MPARWLKEGEELFGSKAIPLDRANDPDSHFCFAAAVLQSVDGGEQHAIGDSSGVFEPLGIEVPYISKSIKDNRMPTYGA